MGTPGMTYDYRQAAKNPESAQYGTFELFASAHKSNKSLMNNLTHVCELDRNGKPTRVLCGRIMLEHIYYDADEDEMKKPARCPTCAKRDPRFKPGKKSPGEA